MNERDDLDRRLMAWLDDPYTPPAPAYLGAVLERTRRTPQRRSWASLERWLPMTITLRRPMLAPSMRLIAIGLALMLALLVALAAVPVLSRLGLLRATVAVPWHNGLIAFGRDGDIWVVDPNGGDPRILIGGSQTVDDGPDWSPDGTQIAFWRTVGGGTTLMVADADGSNIRQLTSGPVVGANAFYWSPDGSMLAMLSDPPTGWQVAVVSADGSSERPLDLKMPVDWVSWHPTGTSLLVRGMTANGAALYSVSFPDGTVSAPIASSDTTTAFYATDHGNSDLTWPAWSPDGSRIAFTNGQSPANGVSGVSGGNDSRDFVMGADGSARRMLQYRADSDYDDNPQWSPDGTRLSMVVRTGAFHQVAIADMVGNAPIVATKPDSDPGGLYTVWSPDGTTILTVRDADGVAAFVDPATGVSTPAPWGAGSPDWQPVASQP